jgi:hypothetical protein
MEKIMARFISATGELFLKNNNVDDDRKLNLDTNKNYVSPQALMLFEESLIKHIEAVREAGAILGVRKSQLAVHDDSKWEPEEFWAYAQQFHGNKADPTGFSLAWNHHIHCNKHHWQHWLHPAGHVVKGTDLFNGAFEMPENYAMEMIADWLGASKCYTGSWDMTEWLEKNWVGMKIHSQTRNFIHDVLVEIKNGKALA